MGAFIVDLDRISDERGFFARSFCVDEMSGAGLISDVVQCNLSFSKEKGTIRGMHYQQDPAPETKLVRCTSGAIVDIIVDLRSDSPTFMQHVAVELTAENRQALFVPRYFAHGFQTLQDNTEVMYLVSERYTPASEAGLRHDDPALGLNWPLPVSALSDKDANWPLI